MNYSRFHPNFLVRGPMVPMAPPKDTGAASDDHDDADDGEEPGEPEDDGETENDEDDGESEDEPNDEDASDGEEDTTASDEGGAGEESEEEAELDLDDDPPPNRVPWQQRRLDRLTAQRRQAEEENARLQAEIERLRNGDGEPNDQDPPAERPGARTYTEEEFQAAVAARARSQAVNDAVDRIYDQCAAADPNFGTHVSNLREAVGPDLAKRPDFFEALIKLDNGAAVMGALVKKPDLLAEILELSPIDLAIRMAKMDAKAAQHKTAAPISRAGTTARPPREVSRQSAPPQNLETMSDEEYEKVRAAQREARAKARLFG